MKIYILLAHPDSDSLNGAFADAYEETAREIGHDVRRQNIGDLNFDPVLWNGHKRIPELEVDLKQAQDNISWCEHWVIFYPIWWGSVPAIFKGFIDRTLYSGFAYKYHDHDPFWDKLLKGRSAQIFTTSDAPWYWIYFQYRNSDLNTVKRATLQFCGINPVRVARFSRVRWADETKEKKVDRNSKEVSANIGDLSLQLRQLKSPTAIEGSEWPTCFFLPQRQTVDTGDILVAQDLIIGVDRIEPAAATSCPNTMNTQKRRYITAPWMLETIVFFGVLWQESFRLSSRTAQRELPVGRWLQNFYYYNFGDFVNGYVMAYLIDGFTELVLGSRAKRDSVETGTSVPQKTRVLIALGATFLSGLVVIAFELGGATLLATTPDVYDIPAGLGGAAFYGFIRLVALRIRAGFC